MHGAHSVERQLRRRAEEAERQESFCLRGQPEVWASESCANFSLKTWLVVACWLEQRYASCLLVLPHFLFLDLCAVSIPAHTANGQRFATPHFCDRKSACSRKQYQIRQVCANRGVIPLYLRICAFICTEGIRRAAAERVSRYFAQYHRLYSVVMMIIDEVQISLAFRRESS
ncbi:hypothetical protein B0J12DRAFT_270841 [Macrophomina phaseolina]|uniref:Uncharacterized protein n=1 Tax=Macrophomina phaseolina TaxID=35725 RepID=A0ABQ8FYE0_9PEZI|nr:hypothetical protein B0J12DRAFT_270841 [Macrophomina phaseolina]